MNPLEEFVVRSKIYICTVDVELTLGLTVPNTFFFRSVRAVTNSGRRFSRGCVKGEGDGEGEGWARRKEGKVCRRAHLSAEIPKHVLILRWPDKSRAVTRAEERRQ